MADDHFHEIQLSGKQLVFLFMATAVVAVVIFLTGVLVGRGVRSETDPYAAGEPLAAPADSGAGFAPDASTETPRSPSQQPAQGAAKPAADDFSYYAQLEGQTPKAPASKPATGAPPAASNVPVVNEPPPPPPTAPPTASVPADPGRGATSGGGGAATAKLPEPPAAATAPPPTEQTGLWAVQVAAFADAATADTELKKLLAKGYPAYVIAPAAGARSPAFRVRVGHFKTRREADEMRRRLEKDQYKTMITR